MKRVLGVISFALLAISFNHVAYAQSQNELSWSVQSNLRSFLTYSDSTYYPGVSELAQMDLSSAAQNATTEEDFKAVMVASRILYCEKVLEDLTYSTPNYSQVKSNFESELQDDLASLKKATE